MVLTITARVGYGGWVGITQGPCWWSRPQYMPGSLPTWHVRISARTSTASVVVVRVRFGDFKHISICFQTICGSKCLFAHVCIYDGSVNLSPRCFESNWHIHLCHFGSSNNRPSRTPSGFFPPAHPSKPPTVIGKKVRVCRG